MKPLFLTSTCITRVMLASMTNSVSCSLYYLNFSQNTLNLAPACALTKSSNSATLSRTLCSILFSFQKAWWRGQDLNLRSSGYEPDEIPTSPPRVIRQPLSSSFLFVKCFGKKVVTPMPASQRCTTRYCQHPDLRPLFHSFSF